MYNTFTVTYRMPVKHTQPSWLPKLTILGPKPLTLTNAHEFDTFSGHYYIYYRNKTKNLKQSTKKKSKGFRSHPPKTTPYEWLLQDNCQSAAACQLSRSYGAGLAHVGSWPNLP